MRTASNLLLPVSSQTPKNPTKTSSVENGGQGAFAQNLTQAKAALASQENARNRSADAPSPTSENIPKGNSTEAASATKDIPASTDSNPTPSGPLKDQASPVNASALGADDTMATEGEQNQQLAAKAGATGSLSSGQALTNNGDLGGKTLQAAGIRAPLIGDNTGLTDEDVSSVIKSSSSEQVLTASAMTPTRGLGTEPAIDSSITVTQNSATTGAEIQTANSEATRVSNSPLEAVPFQPTAIAEQVALAKGASSAASAQDADVRLAEGENLTVSNNAILAGGAVTDEGQVIEGQAFARQAVAASLSEQEADIGLDASVAKTTALNASTGKPNESVGVSPPLTVTTDKLNESMTQDTDALTTSAGKLNESVTARGDASTSLKAPVGKHSETTGAVSSQAALLTNTQQLSSQVQSTPLAEVQTDSSLNQQETFVAGATVAASALATAQQDEQQAPEALSATGEETLIAGATSNKLATEASVATESASDTRALSQALLSSTLKAKNTPNTDASAGPAVTSAGLSAPQQLTTDEVSEPPVDEGLSWVMSQMQASQGRPMVTKALPQEAIATSTAADGLSSVSSKGAPMAGAMAMLGATGQEEVNQLSESSEMFTEGEGVVEEFFANEPIELRKKEQDTLINRMVAQTERGTSDVGGLTSSLQQHGAAKAAPAAMAAGANNAANSQNLAMNLPPNHPGWAGEMTQKVTWVARDGGQTAHIRLDPPELGSLTVKISVDKDATTQVSFVAATPQARDMIEGQMHRLREMLAQQGMELNQVNVDVSQQDASNSQYAQRDRQEAGVGRGEVPSTDDTDMAMLAENVGYVTATGVDYYA